MPATAAATARTAPRSTRRRPQQRASSYSRKARTTRHSAPRTRQPTRRAATGAVPRLVPVAVGRTAIAVGGIADSRFVLSLTRSRLWIGVLGTLLVGIVALNVLALSLNASSSKTAAISDELRRENSALRAEIAGGLSNERLQRAAARLGLVVPEPGAIRYLDPKPGDAGDAAKRLRRGEVTLGSTYVAPVAPVVPVTPTPEAEAEATAPATAETATTETATTEPATTTDPAASVPAGGIGAP